MEETPAVLSAPHDAFCFFTIRPDWSRFIVGVEAALEHQLLDICTARIIWGDTQRNEAAGRITASNPPPRCSRPPPAPFHPISPGCWAGPQSSLPAATRKPFRPEPFTIKDAPQTISQFRCSPTSLNKKTHKQRRPLILFTLTRWFVLFCVTKHVKVCVVMTREEPEEQKNSKKLNITKKRHTTWKCPLLDKYRII